MLYIDRAETDTITFVGEPQAYPSWEAEAAAPPPAPPPPAQPPAPVAPAAEVAPVEPPAQAVGVVLPAAAPAQPDDSWEPSGGAAGGPVQRLRGQIAAAHRAALEAQGALLERMMQLDGGAGAVAPARPPARPQAARPPAARPPAREPAARQVVANQPAAGRPAAGLPVRPSGPVTAVPMPPFVTRVLEASADRASARTECDVPDESTVDGQVPVAVLLAAVQGCRLVAGDRGGVPAALTFLAELPAAPTTLQIETSGGAAAGRTAAGPLFELTDDPTGATPARPAKPPGTARFTPLARTGKRSLTSGDVALLAAGQAADVFGAGYQQDGCNPSLRLPDAGLRMIDRVEDIDRTGGPHRLGSLRAIASLDTAATAPITLEARLVDGALQLVQTYLLYLGAHLVLPDARFQPVTGVALQYAMTGPVPAAGAELRYEAQVFDLGLLPRPHTDADVTVYDGAQPIMTISGVRVEIREKPGTPHHPGPGGRVTAFLGRTSPTGERAELNEFHMAHAAKGDLAVAMGPEFGIYANSKAPYIPNGDFLFVDRMMGWTGERGKLVAGATMDTEYDSPADAWYYQDNGHPFLPYCVLMETSLQSAVLLGYYLGATLPFPQEQFRIRNLDGHAAVVKDVDLRGKTIRQHSSLLFSSAMPGTILQKFRYDLSVDGEIFYTGESLFGYHTVEALSAQIGLDSSEHVPSWLDKTGTPARRIDLRGGGASRLAGAGGLRIGSGQLDLVDEIDIVDGGGDHAAGYIRGRRLVTPDEWYFSCHFHRDPVMPGSLGVEAILQAMQVYVIDTGLAADLRNPRFTMSAGVDMGWRYRGQILQTDPDMNFDIHVKRVVREPDRVVLIGDANLWKHELRIYELTDIAVAVVSGD